MEINDLAQTLVLGSLLDKLRRSFGGFELVDHWQQGEFHHDVLLRIDAKQQLPGAFLVVSTNCNGGIKEVLCFDAPPARGALWKHRCPDSAEFQGTLPPLLARAQTLHWFDPCQLLLPDARSELRPEHRERQAGGGWIAKSCGSMKSAS